MSTPAPFVGYKGPLEVLDFVLNFASEFALDDPNDQLSSAVWNVIDGDVVIDSSRIVGTDLAIARVSGGTKTFSWHEIQCSAVAVSGQTYVRTIRIQIVKQ